MLGWEQMKSCQMKSCPFNVFIHEVIHPVLSHVLKFMMYLLIYLHYIIVKGALCNFYSHLVVKFDFAFKRIYAL